MYHLSYKFKVKFETRLFLYVFLFFTFLWLSNRILHDISLCNDQFTNIVNIFSICAEMTILSLISLNLAEKFKKAFACKHTFSLLSCFLLYNAILVLCLWAYELVITALWSELNATTVSTVLQAGKNILYIPYSLKLILNYEWYILLFALLFECLTILNRSIHKLIILLYAAIVISIVGSILIALSAELDQISFLLVKNIPAFLFKESINPHISYFCNILLIGIFVLISTIVGIVHLHKMNRNRLL